MLLCGCAKKQPTVLKITSAIEITLTIGNKEFKGKEIKLKVKAGKYLIGLSAPGYDPLWRTIDVTPNSLTEFKPTLTLSKTAVLLDSEPSGATVEYNDQAIGTTPYVLRNLHLGNHTAYLSKPGFARQKVDWEIKNNRPLPKILTKLESDTGTLIITTTPTKAKLYINDDFIGETPYKATLKEGTHQLKFHLQGYNTKSTSVTINRNDDKTITEELEPLLSSLEVNSFPTGAEIIFADKKVGYTPYTIESLRPGNYKLKLQLKNHETINKTISIGPGLTEKVNYNLGLAVGEATFYVSPAGIQYYLDGKYMGTTETVAPNNTRTKIITFKNLEPGFHTLRLHHRQAKPTNKDVRFKIVKGEYLKTKPINIWVANCEIYYKDGNVEKGALFSENSEEIMFGPEPGIQYAVKKKDLDKIIKIDITKINK
jgi:hypothetical protein